MRLSLLRWGWGPGVLDVRITGDVLDFARPPAGPTRRQGSGRRPEPGFTGFRLPHFPSGYAGASRIKDAIGK